MRKITYGTRLEEQTYPFKGGIACHEICALIAACATVWKARVRFSGTMPI